MNLFCLYKLQKKKGKFQHSSFLAGGATSAARKLVAQNGTLKVCNSYLQTALTPVLSGNMLTQPELYCWQAIWPHSGHYRPTEENFQEFKSFLNDNLVDLTDAPEETGSLQTTQVIQTTSTETEKREEPVVAREKILQRRWW